MKSWCYTQLLEYELVRKAAVGLDFSIRKKLGNLEVRDMVQLAERARRINQIKGKRTHHSLQSSILKTGLSKFFQVGMELDKITTKIIIN